MGYAYGKTAKLSAEIEADEIIEWVKENLEPDDVFEEEALNEWAQRYDPDEVFEEEDLIKWAEANGFTKA